MLIENELLNNLILIGQLRGHRTAKMLDISAEFINEINKITVKIMNDKQVQIAYNFSNQTIIETVSGNFVYEFLDDLLQRRNQLQITLKYGTLIELNNWQELLQPGLLKIQEEKNYDQYLKHLKLTLDRFSLEYFDGIVVLKDEKKELLTNVFRLRNALQQSL